MRIVYLFGLCLMLLLRTNISYAGVFDIVFSCEFKFAEKSGANTEPKYQKFIDFVKAHKDILLVPQPDEAKHDSENILFLAGTYRSQTDMLTFEKKGLYTDLTIYGPTFLEPGLELEATDKPNIKKFTLLYPQIFNLHNSHLNKTAITQSNNYFQIIFTNQEGGEYFNVEKEGILSMVHKGTNVTVAYNDNKGNNGSFNGKCDFMSRGKFFKEAREKTDIQPADPKKRNEEETRD